MESKGAESELRSRSVRVPKKSKIQSRFFMVLGCLWTPFGTLFGAFWTSWGPFGLPHGPFGLPQAVFLAAFEVFRPAENLQRF